MEERLLTKATAIKLNRNSEKNGKINGFKDRIRNEELSPK